MKHLPLLLLLMSSVVCVSQTTATFTWTGNTDSGGVGLATIDGQPVNSAIGYSGSLQIVNGSNLWLLDLPELLGFPNNGFLDCETTITFGAKVWGMRSNGTKMDGTQAGDSYSLTGTSVCPLWNGTTNISLTEFREMVAHRSCGHGICKTWLVDTEESGSGSASS